MPNAENITKANAKPNGSRDNGRKGGIASGKSRREKRTLCDELKRLLDAKIDGKTGRERISLGLMQRASEGDPAAFKMIRDTIGEMPTDKIDITAHSTTQISFGDMDVTAMATFLADVKEQAQRQQQEQADE